MRTQGWKLAWLERIGLAVVAVGLIFGVWNLVIVAFGLQPFVLPTPQASITSSKAYAWRASSDKRKEFAIRRSEPVAPG